MTDQKSKNYTFVPQDTLQWKPGKEQPKVLDDIGQLERLEESSQHLERVRREGQIGHFQTRPHAGVMLGDMYTAMWMELHRLKDKQATGDLDASEFNRLIKLNETLIKVMKEEREQNAQEQDELRHLSPEALVEQMKEALLELESGNE